MKWRMGLRARITTALLAGVLATVGSASVPSEADAVGVTDIAGYAKTAYDLYQSLAGNELTLEQATSQIQNAVTVAKTQIIAEIDAMKAADIQSCARAAVIDFNDINTMSTDQLQNYASTSTKCVTDAWAAIPRATDKSGVDQMGFALNIVGPIALAVRSKAYGPADAGTLDLRTTVITANQSVLTQLFPQCGGVRGEIVNGRQEVALVCIAYNGDQGDAGTIFISAGASLPTGLDYSAGVDEAMARTGYPVSVGALDGLLPDPTAISPGNQIGYFNQTARLQLAASGGAPGYSWKITGLPPGLTAFSSGLITGTFTQVGTWTVRAKATDLQAQVGSVTFTWTVRSIPQLFWGTITDRSLSVGSSVDTTAGANGGTTPYIWRVTGLPAGLSADPATGRVTGTVRVSPATNSVTFTVTDANAQSDSKTVVWTVTPGSTTVPNVLGVSESTADSMITGAGLVVGSTSYNADCVNPGQVETQNPLGGRSATIGSSVNITISTCPTTGGGGGTGDGGGGAGGGGHLPR
jgi:hypothetical protein